MIFEFDRSDPIDATHSTTIQSLLSGRALYRGAGWWLLVSLALNYSSALVLVVNNSVFAFTLLLFVNNFRFIYIIKAK